MPHKSEVVFPCLQQHAFRVIQLAILVWATTAHNSTEVTRRLTNILLRKTTTLYNLTKKKHQEGHTFSFVGGSSSIPALLNPQCWPVVIIQWWRTSSRNGGEATVVGSGLLYWLRFLPTSALRSWGYCRSLNSIAGRCSWTPWWSIWSVQTSLYDNHYNIWSRCTVHLSHLMPAG